MLSGRVRHVTEVRMKLRIHNVSVCFPICIPFLKMCFEQLGALFRDAPVVLVRLDLGNAVKRLYCELHLHS